MVVKELSSPNFTQCKATQKLKALSLHPFDLTAANALSPERIAQFSASGAGYKILYATERVTREVVDTLFQLAAEMKALEKMELMQSGEILNYIENYPSENRAVLHTAVRDFFDRPNPAKPAREATALAKVEVDKLKPFLKSTTSFTDLVVIGIGGSELGPKAIYLALQYLTLENRSVHFIGNVDPDNTVEVLKKLNLKNTLVCVISKSGTTLETTVNEQFARQYFEKAGLNPKEHFIAVTGEGSPLDNPSKYLECFHIWDWIGGRYSATSIIGGVILSFAYGFDVYWDFLKGAHEMDLLALENDFTKNLPLLTAVLGIWNHNFLDIQTTAIIPYSQALSRFPAHLQQLDMESNGKQIDRMGHSVNFATGPIIWGEPGTNAQHSFFQLIHQGTAPIALELIGFKESQMGKDFKYKGTTSQEKLLANMLAQAIALAQGQKSDNPNKLFLGNRPSHIILGEKLTPFSLGALLALFEHKVAFQGFIWNINSFDQEGVQLGKLLANRIIDRFLSAKGEKDKAPFPAADAYLNHLNSIS